MRPVRLRSAIEERALLGVSGGVGRHEGALRDHPFSIASQRFENAMRQPRSVPLAGQLLRHLRVEQGDAAFSTRLRARRRRRAFQAGSLLDCPRCGRGKRGAVCLDERRRIVDSRPDPRTYLFGVSPRHSRLGHWRKRASMHGLTATLSHVVCQGVQRMRMLSVRQSSSGRWRRSSGSWGRARQGPGGRGAG